MQAPENPEWNPNNLFNAADEVEFENEKKSFLEYYSNLLRELFDNYNRDSTLIYGKNIRGRVHNLDFQKNDFEKEILSADFSEENKKSLISRIEEQLAEVKYLNEEILRSQTSKEKQDYEFIPNDDLEKGNFKTRYLLARIALERFNQMFSEESHETNYYDFTKANWELINPLCSLNNLPDETIIIPYFDVPVKNIPLTLKKPYSEENKYQSEIPPDNSFFSWIYNTNFKYQISLEKIVQEISSLSDQKLLQSDKIYEGSIFINEDEYKKIVELGTKGFTGERFIKSSLSKLYTDNPNARTNDELKIANDVNALASVMAYNQVEPPLAIGLFGNWGSGKSFFMKELEKKIDSFAEEKNKPYCHNVVQITFNSWHYSDANLWASLVTKIFEDLGKYKKVDNKSLKTLIENLSSTKELIADSEQKLGQIKSEKIELTNIINTKKAEINKLAPKLRKLKTHDILDAIWDNQRIKEKKNEIEKKLPETVIDNYQTVQSKINELSSLGNQLFESFRIIYKLGKGKKPTAIIIFLLVFVFLFFGIGLIDKSEGLISWVSAQSAIAVSALTQIFAFILPVMGKVKSAYKDLKALEEIHTKLEDQNQKLYNKELKFLEDKLQNKENQLTAQQKRLDDLKLDRIKYKNEIEDISSGKKLSNFIAERASDKRYTDSLGIISWIRKDFEDLNFLLKQQHELNAEELEELKKKKVDGIFRIDRIILYIDDLDRCNEEIVVKVLEAIHLLLAFPLFIVVVGVDPRWMHSAITVKYDDFLSNNVSKNHNHKFTPEIKHKGMDLKQASSYDYLEKIFQIPFILKPIDKTGKNNLIESKFKSIIEQTPTEEDENSTTNVTRDTSKGTQTSVATNVSKPSATGGNASQPTPQTATNIPTRKQTVQEPNSELLEVSRKEVDFMKNISFIIGNSPRTINRYINIYRIIRTHSGFGFTDQNELEHYYAAMVLLAFITGIPDSAKVIFSEIEKEADHSKFFSLIQNYSQQNPKEILINELFSKMSEAQDIIDDNNLIKQLNNIEILKFKKNLNLVSRFRFRN